VDTKSESQYLIEGLTAETHAPYCREALRAVLTACPNIHGVTFRIHGESGVPEGNYDLWKQFSTASHNVVGKLK